MAAQKEAGSDPIEPEKIVQAKYPRQLKRFLKRAKGITTLSDFLKEKDAKEEAPPSTQLSCFRGLPETIERKAFIQQFCEDHQFDELRKHISDLPKETRYLLMKQVGVKLRRLGQRSAAADVYKDLASLIKAEWVDLSKEHDWKRLIDLLDQQMWAVRYIAFVGDYETASEHYRHAKHILSVIPANVSLDDERLKTLASLHGELNLTHASRVLIETADIEEAVQLLRTTIERDDFDKNGAIALIGMSGFIFTKAKNTNPQFRLGRIS